MLLASLLGKAADKPTPGTQGLQHVNSFCLSPSIPNQTSSNKSKRTCTVLVSHHQTSQDPVPFAENHLPFPPNSDQTL